MPAQCCTLSLGCLGFSLGCRLSCEALPQSLTSRNFFLPIITFAADARMFASWEGGGKVLVCLPVPASFGFAQGRSSTELCTKRANVYFGGRRLEQCCIQVQISIKPVGMKTGADTEVQGPAGAHTAPQGQQGRGSPGLLPCHRYLVADHAVVCTPCPRCSWLPSQQSPAPSWESLGDVVTAAPCPGSSPSDHRSCHPPDLPKREGLAHSKQQLCMRFSSFQLTLLPSAPIP